VCNFLSACVLRNGHVLTHPMLDSHSDLVRYFKLPDTTAYHQHFAKAELTPVDWMDVATWKFRLDEESAPGWWDDVSAAAEAELRRRANAMILRDGEHQLIVDGCWIIGGTAKVRDIRSGRIMRVQDTAMLSDVGGSAQVSDVRGNAQVSHVRGSARVSGLWGSARVSDVGRSAQVFDVGGSAQVSDVRDNARVSDVWDSARVSDVRDNAQVSHVRDNAQVSDVWDSARVSDVRDNAQVSHVRDNAQVSDVWDNAQVSDVGPSVVLDDSAKAHLVKTVPSAAAKRARKAKP
jgi:hypothetical protein